ncbi:MAG: UDP-glucose--hexose-1-phosphate uridylyltransferase [Acidobacteriota bacterium]
MEMLLKDHSHKRFNILTREWVLVSPNRTDRPWQGQKENNSGSPQESYDPDCYLCPGNKRIHGVVNPNYTSTFVFENDFAALKQKGPGFELNEGLLKAKSESGVCKVICFSPDHSKSLSNMTIEAISEVISAWQSEYIELGRFPDINYVQIFENKGSVMGCSNPHPHGQIWAQSSIPDEVQKKNISQKEYFEKKRSGLLEDYLSQEFKSDERIVYKNKDFVVLVPFWAIWPFEAMIAPLNRSAHIGLMTKGEKLSFAKAIKVLTLCYDRIFNYPFPYSAGIHQAPTDGKDHKEWHWHMSFYPPLLRSSKIKKFMVGFEMFAMPQRDFTAEFAAGRLRELINSG